MFKPKKKCDPIFLYPTIAYIEQVIFYVLCCITNYCNFKHNTDLCLCLCVKSCPQIFIFQQQKHFPNLFLPKMCLTQPIYSSVPTSAINNRRSLSSNTPIWSTKGCRLIKYSYVASLNIHTYVIGLILSLLHEP